MPAKGNSMAGDTPDLSGLLSGLLENPGALGALTGLLGGLRTERQPTAPMEEAPPQREAPPPLPSPVEGERGGRTQRERERLLAALCPYLSPERRRALEGAKKLFEVLELFKK